MNAGIAKAQSKSMATSRNIRDVLPECTIAGDAALRSSLPNISDTLPKCAMHRI